MPLRQMNPERPSCCTFCASLELNQRGICPVCQPQRCERSNCRSVMERDFRIPYATPSPKACSPAPTCSRIKLNGCSFEVCGQEESTLVKLYTPTSDMPNVYFKTPCSLMDPEDPKRSLDKCECQETKEISNRVSRCNKLPTLCCGPNNEEGTSMCKCNTCCTSGCAARCHRTTQNIRSSRCCCDFSRDSYKGYENTESSMAKRPTSLRNTLHCDVELDLPVQSSPLYDQYYSQHHGERTPSEIVVLHADSNDEEPTEGRADISAKIPSLTVPDNSSMFLIKQDGSILDLTDYRENDKQLSHVDSDSVDVIVENGLNAIKIPRNCSLFLIQANQPGSSNNPVNAKYCVEIEKIPTTITRKNTPIFLTTSSYEEELKSVANSPTKIQSPSSSTTAIKSDSRYASNSEEYVRFDTNNDVDSKILTCSEAESSKGNYENMDENDISNLNLKGNIQEEIMEEFVYHLPNEAKILSHEEPVIQEPEVNRPEEVEEDMFELGGISAVQEPDGSVKLLISRSNAIETGEEGNLTTLKDSSNPGCIESIRLSTSDLCRLPPVLSSSLHNPSICLKGSKGI